MHFQSLIQGLFASLAQFATRYSPCSSEGLGRGDMYAAMRQLVIHSGSLVVFLGVSFLLSVVVVIGRR